MLSRFNEVIELTTVCCDVLQRDDLLPFLLGYLGSLYSKAFWRTDRQSHVLHGGRARSKGRGLPFCLSGVVIHL